MAASATPPWKRRRRSSGVSASRWRATCQTSAGTSLRVLAIGTPSVATQHTWVQKPDLPPKSRAILSVSLPFVRFRSAATPGYGILPAHEPVDPHHAQRRGAGGERAARLVGRRARRAERRAHRVG